MQPIRNKKARTVAGKLAALQQVPEAPHKQSEQEAIRRFSGRPNRNHKKARFPGLLLGGNFHHLPERIRSTGRMSTV